MLHITHLHTHHTHTLHTTHITPHTPAHTHTRTRAHSPWSAFVRRSGTLGTPQSPVHRKKDLSCGLSASQTIGCWSGGPGPHTSRVSFNSANKSGNAARRPHSERRPSRGEEGAEGRRQSHGRTRPPHPRPPCVSSQRGRLSSTRRVWGVPRGAGRWGGPGS